MGSDIKRMTATGILALSLGAWALPALAVAPLEGRTITGDRVDAYDASAVMIYDPNADLTWLRDWNVNGAKTWQEQVVWAGTLNVGSFANWSLPTALDQDGSGPCGESYTYNCTGSQMGNLWYEVLGNTAGSLTNAGPFQNMKEYYYATSTLDARSPDLAVWVFSGVGEQRIFGKINVLYAVAVRPGDVAAPIPEPQTWAMLMMGLGVVTAAWRRRPG